MRKIILLISIASLTLAGCNRSSSEASNAVEQINRPAEAATLPQMISQPVAASSVAAASGVGEASNAAAVVDYSARPSLSAAEHFAAAKAIDDESENTEQEISTEAAMRAVWHLEQAIAMGYPDRKRARLLLQSMLGSLAMSNYACVMGKYKGTKDISIQKLCEPFVAAGERAINMTLELYRDYPDDPKIVHSYYIYISGAGASQMEKETVLRKSLELTKSPEIEAALAYVLVGEQKFEEAKARFAEALELVSDEYLLADNLERFVSHLRGFGCAMPAETELALKAIPDRYKPSEAGIYMHKQNAKPTKEELEDSKKLAAIKKQVIDAIRKAQCKAPG